MEFAESEGTEMKSRIEVLNHAIFVKVIGVICCTNLTQELVPLIAKLRRVLKMQRICNFLDLQENYQVNQKAATTEGYVKMHPFFFLKMLKAGLKLYKCVNRMQIST